MSAKGINPLEAHWEKIALGVVLLAAIGILVMQFTSSRQVTVGSKSVPIHKAYGELKTRAQVVKGQLEAVVEEADMPQPPAGSPGAAVFASALAEGVAPKSELAIALGGTGAAIEATSGVGAANDVRLAVLEVPATSSPEVATVLGTLHPAEYKNSPEVRALLADPEVPDHVSVSVEAEFDAATLLARLSTDPDGPSGPIVPIPRSWWNNRVEILAVQLEREELRAGGEWGDRTIVDQMPGRFSLLEELENVEALDQMDAMVQAASQEAGRVRRPRYYDHVFGAEWVEPSAVETVAVSVADDPAIRRELRQLEQVQRGIDAAIKNVQKEGGQTQEPFRLEDGEAGRGRDVQPQGQGRGQGRPGRGRDQPADSGPNQRVIDRNLATIDRNVEQETDIIESLLDAGVPEEEINFPSNWQGFEDAPDPRDEAEDEIDDLPLLESDMVRVWNHDVTVERGKTYRYRMVISINNPMFGHDAGLVEEQKSMASIRLLQSAPSAWSAPVRVDDQTYYFITSAHEGGVGGIGNNRNARATALIASFRWGYWRTGTVNLQPGDLIAGGVDAPELGETFTALFEAVPEIDAPAGDPGRPVGRPGRQMDRPNIAPGRDRGPGRGGRRGPGGFDDQPFDVEDIEFGEVSVRHEAVFLDVSELPGRDEVKRAFVRNADGGIAVHDPESVRGLESYLRIAQSAAAGKEALTPREAEPEDGGFNRPPPRDPGGGFQPPPGGGGGGGG